MKKAVIYARVASDDYKNSSLELQVKMLKRFARKNGYKIENVYSERGSGLQTNPALSHLLQEIEYGNIKRIICRDFSRFTRKLCDWLRIEQLIKEKEVEVITL